jgi:hypothetical protein
MVYFTSRFYPSLCLHPMIEVMTIDSGYAELLDPYTFIGIFISIIVSELL